MKLPATGRELANLIDHTLLKPHVTIADLRNAIEFAHNFNCRGVCIPPFFVEKAREFLDKLCSKTRLVTVIGFPLGFHSVNTKISEIAFCKALGADEFDVVMNINLFKSGDFECVLDELKKIVKTAHPCPVKVIIETAYLTSNEIKKACEIVIKSGAKYVKTCTGFGPRGVTKDDIILIKQVVKNRIKIKASGGIKTAAQALELLVSGADILGASRTKQILDTFSPQLLKRFEKEQIN